MTLLPRSLLWRSFFLIGSLIVISLLLTIWLARINERVPRAKQLAQQVTSVVNLSRTALITVPKENRRFLLTELLREEGLRIYPDLPEATPGVKPRRAFGQLLEREIKSRLGQDTRVEFGRQGLAGLWVSFNIDEDVYWLAMPRIPLERTLPTQLLIGLGASVLLALLGAWFIAWHVNRPLRALALSAARIGKGVAGSDLPESGPEEIRRLTQTFNQMHHDLTRLNEERTLMLAGISHDLRTPLTRLRLAVEMQNTPAQAGMVQDIEDMDAIIGQFLAYARGIEEAPRDIADLNAIVREVAERYTRAGTDVRLELAPVPPLRLSALSIQRLLGNVIDNALRYGAEPISIITAIADKEIWLTIADSGPGIASAERETALHAFTRLNTARGGDGGAGLGLAIVARIAQQHGGKVRLLNREGGGLEVRVSLPLTAN